MIRRGRHSGWFGRGLSRGLLRRISMFGFVAIFGLIGSPNFTRASSPSGSGTEEETKAPPVEEEFRVQAVVHETARARESRQRATSMHCASCTQHVGNALAHNPSRSAVLARRVMDKQFGLGAYLRC